MKPINATLLFLALASSAACVAAPRPTCTAHGIAEMQACAWIPIGRVMALVQPVRNSQPITDYFIRVPVSLEHPDGWAAMPAKGVSP
jgi:hypothetical protein